MYLCIKIVQPILGPRSCVCISLYTYIFSIPNESLLWGNYHSIWYQTSLFSLSKIGVPYLSFFFQSSKSLLHLYLIHSLMVTNTSEKPYKMINICMHVPLILELDLHNYDAWRELFQTHCAGYGLTSHLTSLIKTLHNTVNVEWDHVNVIVKSQIYGTLSQTLLNIVHKQNAFSYVVWINLEKRFCDNKDVKVFQIDMELHLTSDSEMFLFRNGEL